MEPATSTTHLQAHVTLEEGAIRTDSNTNVREPDGEEPREWRGQRWYARPTHFRLYLPVLDTPL